MDISSKVSFTYSPGFFAVFIYLILYARRLHVNCVQGITKPKEVRRFKGEGMPLHFSTKNGDLYITFEVLFPTSLTENQKIKIKEVLG